MATELIILLVGGYGYTGRIIAAEIQRLRLGNVIIAGRDPNKGRATALEIDTTFQYAAFDILHFGMHEKSIVDRSDVVIVCVDQTDTTFAAYCLSSGKLYIDITASSDFLAKTDSLNEVAIRHKSLAIVSVGLCPGLTNLVAAEVKSTFPQADEIATGLLLALGEPHGRASVEWTIENYINDFSYGQQAVRSFFDWHWFRFPDFSKKRKAYRFNFSDQHALHRSYPQYDFRTYLCFDSPFLSTLLHRFKLYHIDRVFRLPFIKSAMVNLVSAFSFGKQGFSCECIAIEKGKPIGRLAFYGAHTGLTTASVAVAVLARVRDISGVYGVKHIQEIFRLADISPYVVSKTRSLFETPAKIVNT